MNRHHVRASCLLITLVCCLLPTAGCIRQAPVATPYPSPDVQRGGEQKEETATPVRQSRSDNSLAASIRRQARQLARQGRPEAAARVLERGLRATPKNAWLWSDLARIRLEQGRFEQAEVLARKANDLAQKDPILRKQIRNIIRDVEQRKSAH